MRIHKQPLIKAWISLCCMLALSILPVRWSRSFGQPPGWNKPRPVPGFWF